MGGGCTYQSHSTAPLLVQFLSRYYPDVSDVIYSLAVSDGDDKVGVVNSTTPNFFPVRLIVCLMVVIYYYLYQDFYNWYFLSKLSIFLCCLVKLSSILL